MECVCVYMWRESVYTVHTICSPFAKVNLAYVLQSKESSPLFYASVIPDLIVSSHANKCNLFDLHFFTHSISFLDFLILASREILFAELDYNHASFPQNVRWHPLIPQIPSPNPLSPQLDLFSSLLGFCLSSLTVKVTFREQNVSSTISHC